MASDELKSTWPETRRDMRVQGAIMFIGDDLVPLAWIVGQEEHRDQDKKVFEWTPPSWLAVNQEVIYGGRNENKIYSVTLPTSAIGKVGDELSDFYYTFRDRHGNQTYKRDQVNKLRERINKLEKQVQRERGENVTLQQEVDRARKRTDERRAEELETVTKLAQIGQAFSGKGRSSGRSLNKLVERLESRTQGEE